MLSRKIVVSVAGVVLFLAAGAFTMMFKPSEPQYVPSRPKPATQQEATPSPQEAPASPPSSPAPATEPEPPEPAEYYVYITGAVKKPGVYKFKDGARIYQAVESAGGFAPKADAAALNLAEFLEDRMHIHVDYAGQTPQQAVRPSPNTSSLVNINTANAQELQRLKGVGPALAKRIVEYRQIHGGFTSPDDLLNVRGIGKSALDRFRAQLTFSGGTYSSNSTGGLININTASAQELQTLKGIGPALAKRIIEYRQTHGAFSRPEDLINVRGIGSATLSKFRSQIEVR